MSTYAVALVNHLADDGLQLRAATAENWWDALQTAFPGYLEYLVGEEGSPAGPLEEAKTVALNQDWEFDVLRVGE